MSLSRILFAAFLLLLFYAVFVEPFRLKVTTYRLELSGLHEPLRILFLSDFQLRGEPGLRESWILKRISQWDYDLICVTGDLFDTKSGMGPAIHLLERFSKTAPTYAVLGNWEHWSKADLQVYKQELATAGVHLLVNESTVIDWETSRISLIGVDDPSELRQDLNLAMRDVDPGSAKILLTHAPAIFPEAASRGIDLVLAGHTHGGQVRIPVIGVVYLPPGCDRYDYGPFRLQRSTLLVTSGIGTSVLPIRFLCPPEVVLLELQPKAELKDRYK